MRTNNQTNNLIKWIFILCDILILNAVLFASLAVSHRLVKWDDYETHLFLLMCNVAMFTSEYHFYTIIHERVVGAGRILSRDMKLVLTQILLSYLLLRAIQFDPRVGVSLLCIGAVMLVLIVLSRLIERKLLQRFRRLGHNTRLISIVGSHKDVIKLYDKLLNNPTYGYKLKDYYGDLDELSQQGSVADFINLLDTPEKLSLGDELYLCIPRNNQRLIERVSQYCDSHMVKFYYVPLQEETLNLQSIMYDEI